MTGHDQGWENLRWRDSERDDQINVGRTERWLSGAAGVGLLLYGIRRKGWRWAALPLGVGLIRRAVTGHCEVNQALGRNSAEGEQSSAARLARGSGRKIEQAVTVYRPREELFRFWRNFDNLPRFMDHLESVTVLDERRSHWVAKGPMGARVEWDAEIHNEVPDELIAWRSLPGSDVDHAGSVNFSPVHNGGTDVRVIMRYAVPAGRAGDAVAHLLGEDPERQIADDLRRFKQVMEAAETPGVLASSPAGST